MPEDDVVPDPDELDAEAKADAEDAGVDDGDGPQMSPEDIEALLASVGDAVSEVSDAATSASSVSPAPAAESAAGAGANAFALPSFDKEPTSLTGRQQQGMKLLEDVTLDVQIELGRSRMFVEDVLRLGPDCVIELDKAAGDPVDIYVNNRHVARGEVLVVNDNFCVRVSEIIKSTEEDDG